MNRTSVKNELTLALLMNKVNGKIAFSAIFSILYDTNKSKLQKKVKLHRALIVYAQLGNTSFEHLPEGV